MVEAGFQVLVRPNRVFNYHVTGEDKQRPIFVYTGDTLPLSDQHKIIIITIIMTMYKSAAGIFYKLP
jgi:hypothetical protein